MTGGMNTAPAFPTTHGETEKRDYREALFVFRLPTNLSKDLVN